MNKYQKSLDTIKGLVLSSTLLEKHFKKDFDTIQELIDISYGDCSKRVGDLFTYLTNMEIKFELVNKIKDYNEEHENKKKADKYIIVPMWRVKNE